MLANAVHLVDMPSVHCEKTITLGKGSKNCLLVLNQLCGRFRIFRAALVFSFIFADLYSRIANKTAL